MIRVLIVDDQNLIRHALQAYLEPESDLEVVGYAYEGLEALEQIKTLAPDVALVDIEMPGMDGLTTIKVIRERFPETKVLVLSSHEEAENINNAVKAGAQGYLPKNTPSEELVHAIRYVNKGYFQLGPGLSDKLQANELKSSSAELVELEQKFEQRWQEIAQKLNSLGKGTPDQILTELQINKSQLYKINIAYKKLAQQVSWLIIGVVSLFVFAIAGAVIAILVGLFD